MSVINFSIRVNPFLGHLLGGLSVCDGMTIHDLTSSTKPHFSTRYIVEYACFQEIVMQNEMSGFGAMLMLYSKLKENNA